MTAGANHLVRPGGPGRDGNARSPEKVASAPGAATSTTSPTGSPATPTPASPPTGSHHCLNSPLKNVVQAPISRRGDGRWLKGAEVAMAASAGAEAAVAIDQAA